VGWGRSGRRPTKWARVPFFCHTLLPSISRVALP
jgi:hypothetical protein